MLARTSRRLSIAAVASASLAGVAGLGLVPAAHATTSADPATSPLTVDTGNGTIQTVGGASVQAAVLPANDMSWSPDGSQYVLVRGNDLWVANADGSGLRKVAADAAGNGTHPVWAFGGTEIVYSAYVVGVRGGGTQVRAVASNGATVDSSWLLPGGSAEGSGTSDLWPDYAAGTVVFQRQPTNFTAGSQSEIWVLGPNGSQPYRIALGASPTVSPDGKLVAFIAPDNNKVPQIWTVQAAQPAGGALVTPIQQTFGTIGSANISYSPSEPTFAPDGRSIAFVETTQASVTTQSVSSLRTIAVNAVANATSNPEAIPDPSLTLNWNGRSRPSYRTEYKKHVTRLAGSDRFATAVAVSQAAWRGNGDTADQSRAQASVAVLSRSDLPADALGGSSLASRKNGPLLLTDSKTLSASTLAELHRALAPGATVYLLGGVNALSQPVEDAVRAAGFTPSRIAGPDRYATAVAIARQVVSNPTDILVATGVSFADALSAGAAAGAQPGTVVVLTDDKLMPAATMAYLNGFATDFGPASKVSLWGVGGQAVAAIDSSSKGAWHRVPEVGADRYETSYLLAHDFFGGMTSVGLATGLAWPDALSGGAFMGSNSGPLLLVDPKTGMTPKAAAYFNDSRGEIHGGFVFGGPLALPKTAESQLGGTIAGPMGWTA